jgi:modulator of FtsH protease
MDLREALLQRSGGSKAASRVGFIKRVYGLFTASLLLSALCAMVALYAGAPSPDEAGGAPVLPPVVALFAAHPLLSTLVAMGVMVGARAVRRVPDINVLALFGMAAVLGFTFAPALFMAGMSTRAGDTLSPAPVRDAFILSVLTFGALSLGALFSDRDFSFLGAGLVMGGMVVLGAMLLNIFLGSSALGLALASVSVLLFGGYVLFNTSRLLRSEEEDPAGGALDLYLNFVSLFFAVLRLLSGRRP